MAKRAKRLTKRERKALEGKGRSGHEGQHIHCVTCGRHIDAGEMTSTPSQARWLRCQHGTRYAACTGCAAEGTRRLAEHDRTGQPVSAAAAWH